MSTPSDSRIVASLLAVTVVIVVWPVINPSFAQDRRLAPVRSSSQVVKRKALVIGNATYAEGKLTNPVNDARAIAKVLGELNFTVTLREDLDRKRLDTEVNSFAQSLNKDDVAVFYYAGHGIEIGGENFLVPIGFSATSEADVKYGASSAQWVLEKLEEKHTRLNVLILDACRDNKFRGWSRSDAAGLASMQGGRGTLIAFATSPGKTASDNKAEANGLFTEHLLRNLRLPGLEVEEVFKRTRNDVDTASAGKQVPWVSTSVIGSFVLNTSSASEVEVPPTEQAAAPGPIPGSRKQRIREADQAVEVLMPNGSFPMGSARGEADEKPIHRVTLTQDYWIDQHEVTVGQYYRVIGVRPNPDAAADDYPAVNVDWADATSYCEGVGGRLPTEAEWERAARGGLEGKTYPWGDEKICAGSECRANGSGAYATPKRAPVCKFSTNQYGLCDMAGNVWEWVQDWYLVYPKTELTDPKGPNTGIARVFRGGSWASPPADLSVANRDRNKPGYRATSLGFRCVRGAAQPADIASRPQRTRGEDHAIEVLIPSGDFAMGSDDTEDERPIHRVTLTRNYWMDQHEVTVGQYFTLVGVRPDGNIAGDDHPVVNVNWASAMNYCRKVGGRLPTEAEWERAGRGGLEHNRYPWGNEVNCEGSACRANSDGADGFPKTAPVCKFSSNQYGLCDMAGNVWEWVQDWRSRYPETETTDPTGPDTGERRVVRGGSWNEDQMTSPRVANRGDNDPTVGHSTYGFRCVRDSN